MALPGDDAFDKKKNTYDIPSYNRLSNQFGISPSTDFRFHEGMNHGLGNVYIYYTNIGYGKTEASYPETYKFSDEGGSASDGNLNTFQIHLLKISMSTLLFLYLTG